MKKTFSNIIVMAIVAMIMGACAENKLMISVALMNSKCPIDFNKGTIESVTLEDDTLCFKMTFKEYQEVKQIEQNPFLGKMFCQTMLLGLKEKNSDLIQQITDAKVNLKILFTSSWNTKEISTNYTAAEIAELLESEIDLASMILYSTIEATNKILPKDLGNGLTQTSMTLEETAIINKFDVDEKKIKISDMKKEAATIKNSFITNFKTNPQQGEFTRIVAETGREYKYIYTGSATGEVLEVTITNQELKDALE